MQPACIKSRREARETQFGLRVSVVFSGHIKYCCFFWLISVLFGSQSPPYCLLGRQATEYFVRSVALDI